MNSHRLYAPPNTIDVAVTKAANVLVWKTPTKIMNSPTNEEVPGRAMLAMVKNLKKATNNGMV